jgi:hypothetical protein
MNEPQQVLSDERLVEATLAGDDDAFSELVRRYKTKVFRLAARFVRETTMSWTTSARRRL